MKHLSSLVVLVVLVVIALLTTAVAFADSGVNVTTDFRGTPQFDTPTINNSGTVTLTLHGLTSLASLDEGRMIVRADDGRTFKMRNMWENTGPSSYRWVQYVPFDIIEMWIDTSETIDWASFGPWVVRPAGNGLVKKEQITKINIFLPDPIYRDWNGVSNPTWDWTLKAEPEWAARQWPWWDNVSMNVETSCNGHAGNHGGMFAWDGMVYNHPFGNDVVRYWLKQPFASVTWHASAEGWEQTGTTQGPICWTRKTSLPLVR